ncbi:hypothetical protein MNBD_ALPHA06-2218 [hydrothermal vent metagenome]|uniref:General secretion pathway protein I n=1 Tax=hydrothermal vent metagenome TaxID=652676 RepID=A0A3B0REW3_9ZZZZ
MKPSDNKSGFTLLEAVIALLLASSGLAMVFQSMTGAATLQAAAMEMSKTRIVAESVMANAGQMQTGENGVQDDIAWSVVVEPVALSETGRELVRIRVLALGPMGREVQLVSEAIRSAPQ